MISARILLNVTSFLLLLQIFNAKAEPPLKEAPCDYKDTVSLHSALKYDNGSYLYDDIIVPANETGTYKYIITVENEKNTTEVHVRGCICKFRKCISICCPDKGGELFGETCVNSIIPIDEFIDIKTKLGKTVSVNISNHFVKQIYKPCAGLYSFVQGGQLYNYTLFEDGTISYNNTIFTKNEYCMNPVLMYGYMFIYVPAMCFVPNPPGSDTIVVNGIVMLVSVPFMLITIWVYMLQPNTMLTIKSTCFYLLSLSVAFTTMAMINYLKNPSNEVCSVLGYTTYFAFIASYSWLTVISYDLFKHLPKQRNSYTEGMKFTYYSLFAWGLPTLLFGFTLFAQEQNWDSEYKPNIGGKHNCFFEQHGNNKMIYFYAPGTLLISLNVIMFFLTLKQINNASVRNALKSNKLKLYSEKCGLFARLYLLTGVAWILEFLSYCFPGIKILDIILFILVQCQGYLIFLLVVFKKSSRKEFYKRYPKLFGRQDSTLSSNQSTASIQKTTI